MYGVQNKWCFVPNCNNTSVKDPNKKFLSIPQNHSRKVKWFEAAKRDLPTSKSTFYCCEDHFNLEDDMENYIRYRFMGGKIKLKDGIVPHIFNCQGRKGAASTSEQYASLKQENDPLVEEALIWERKEENYTLSDFSPTAIHSEEPSTTQTTDSGLCSTSSNQVERMQNVTKFLQTRSVGVQVKPPFRSKYITCQVKPSVRSKYVTCNIIPKRTSRKKRSRRKKKIILV